jgi:hypothetical protein
VERERREGWLFVRVLEGRKRGDVVVDFQEPDRTRACVTQRLFLGWSPLNNGGACLMWHLIGRRCPVSAPFREWVDRQRDPTVGPSAAVSRL